MRWLDRRLQDWRAAKACRWIPDGARVLDIGCFDGRLFRRLGSRLGQGVGVDPLLDTPVEVDTYSLVPGDFPDTRPDGAPFDVVTMLAVLEHVPADDLDRWTAACRDSLGADGIVVATVPAPVVDRILGVLMRLRILDGMETGQHHGFDPEDAITSFEHAGFALVARRRFQLGLNNLFVFGCVNPDVS